MPGSLASAAIQIHHQPVLLEACLELLAVSKGRLFVDGTLGDGGHAEAILARSAPDGRLLGLDRDPEAIAISAQRLARYGHRAQLVHASFRDLQAVLAARGIAQVDGVLLDLGVSSRQLGQARRGFRFLPLPGEGEVPLDMRMDPSAGPTAAQLLARASAVQLEGWLRDYGEVPAARRLARLLVEARRNSPPQTAAELRELVRRAGAGRGRRHHRATLVFQALRIAVNDELGALKDGLDAAIEALAEGGRLCVLSYHSLEDRIVKNRLRDEERGCVCPPVLPVCTCGRSARLRRLTRRPRRPGAAEVRDNPRARSARLRAAQRLAA